MRSLPAPEDFSLVLGGPLFQLLRRSHLAGNALELVRRPPHHHPAARLAAPPGPLGAGRTGAGRERGRPLPAGCGSACPLSGGAAAVDRGRAGGAPAYAVRGAAIPGTPLDSRERPATVRGRHHVGTAAAQLRTRRGAAACFCLYCWRPADLAPVPGAPDGHVVRGADRRGVAALAHRRVVWLRESAALPVPAAALVSFAW